MFDGIMESYGSRFIIAAGGVAIALLLLVAVLWIMRNRASSPFVRGGRNRQPRLQVLDAAAVDARRRLVLVRRDDVEHLIMIGGPSDIVIESRILPDGQVETISEPARPEAPQPAAPSERPAEPVMTAAVTEPEPAVIIPPAPRPAPTRGLSPIEEFAPAAERLDTPPIAPPPAPQHPVFEPEIEPAPRPVAVPVAPASIAPTPVAPHPQPPVFSRREPAPIETAEAVDILDSARQRVLTPQRIEPQVMSPPSPPQRVDLYPPAPHAPTPQPAAFQPVARPAPSAQPSDFQRVLEEEMTSNLTAERPLHAQSAPMHNTPGQNAPSRPVPGNLPRRDPEMSPITGADAALQNEVARIFGEMSVNRDK